MTPKVIVLRVAKSQELKLRSAWEKVAMGQEGEAGRDRKRRFIYDQSRNFRFVLQGQCTISQYIIVVPTDAKQRFKNLKAPCVLAFFSTNT